MREVMVKVVAGLIVTVLVVLVFAIGTGLTYLTCSGIWYLICLGFGREFGWGEAFGFWIIVQLASVLIYGQRNER
jgi:hypothetical protein